MLPLLSLMWAHFIGDFLLQPSFIQTGKSRSNWLLLFHILTYASVLLFAAGLLKSLGLVHPTWYGAIGFILGNVCAHAVIDHQTSRAMTKARKRGERWDEMLILGFDQALHITVLILTLPWLVGA